MEPLLLRPRAAFAAIGVGMTKGYELIASGDLKAVKYGRMTFIPIESVKAFAERVLNS